MENNNPLDNFEDDFRYAKRQAILYVIIGLFLLGIGISFPVIFDQPENLAQALGLTVELTLLSWMCILGFGIFVFRKGYKQWKNLNLK